MPALVTQVRQVLDERSAGVFWTDDHVYDACNEALLEVWADVKPQSAVGTMTLTASADIVAWPSTIWIPQVILGTSGKYFPTTQADLERWKRKWRSEARGYPKHWVVWDMEHFRATPSPDATYTFTVWGVGWPDEISSTNTDVSVDAELKLAIALRAAGDLLEATRPDAAEAVLAEYDEARRKYKAKLRNTHGHNIRRIRPGTRFTKALGGHIKIGRTYT